jgi:pimeloyl-ACP methyl ester carboxylesterase
MADVLLHSSPLVPGVSPVCIHYRDAGEGPPIVILHGGWGYDVYPFDRQIDALSPRHRIIIPDRTGYGGSRTIDWLPIDFHQRAADETRAVIDALGLERPVLWGHSDGAIIALLIGLAAPDEISGVIVEATHYFKRKPGSRAFFEGVAAKPRSKLLETHSRTWLRIADEAAPGEDFYGGRLSELRPPRLVIHGARDPRTEPGELKALQAALERGAEGLGQVEVFADGGHSPHSEQATSAQVIQAALRFLTDVGRRGSADVSRGFPPTFVGTGDELRPGSPKRRRHEGGGPAKTR